MKRLAIWLATAAVLVAADASGVWSGSIPGRDGQSRAISFNLKQNGERLEGSVRGPAGKDVELTDGAVKGDDVQFKVNISLGDRSISQSYSGKLVGDELQLKVMREGGRRATEITLRRNK